MATVDYEGKRTRPLMPRQEGNRYNVVAAFPSPEAAGRAVQELCSQGMAGTEVRVLGSTEDAVVNNLGMTEPDRMAATSLTRDGAMGLAGGAVAGALLGLVVMALPPFQSASGFHGSAGSYLVAALIGAILGLTLGGLVGGIAGLDRRRSGIEAYDMQVAEGTTMVGVHTESEAATRSATGSLRACGAMNVQTVGRNQNITV